MGLGLQANRVVPEVLEVLVDRSFHCYLSVQPVQQLLENLMDPEVQCHPALQMDLWNLDLQLVPDLLGILIDLVDQPVPEVRWDLQLQVNLWVLEDQVVQ